MSTDRFLSFQELESLLGTPVQGKVNPQTELACLSTDTRSLNPRDLFVAIRGEKFDGHDYLHQAVTKGAGALIIDRPVKNLEIPSNFSGPVFQVADSIAALRTLAKFWRQNRVRTAPVIVVAGSVGKTTTKEFIASILKGKYQNVLVTEGSQNGFLGIALTLLRWRDHHEAAVVEVGIDDLGAMIQHLEVIRPTVSIVTALGPEHLEQLGNMQNVANEESLALRWVLENGGSAVLNLDEPLLTERAQKWPRSKLVGYRLETTSNSEVSSLSLRTDKSDLDYLVLQGTWKSLSGELHVQVLNFSFKVPLPGEHNARNFLGAIAVARTLQLTAEEISLGLSRFQAPWGRSDLRELKGDVRVLCDFYNANPTSMRAAFETAVQVQNKSNLVFCLGDMLELGAGEKAFHEELSADLAMLKPRLIVLVGTRMKWLRDSLPVELQGTCFWFLNSNEAADHLKSKTKGGDLVLIKGSRGMRLEVVWEALSAGADT